MSKERDIYRTEEAKQEKEILKMFAGLTLTCLAQTMDDH